MKNNIDFMRIPSHRSAGTNLCLRLFLAVWFLGLLIAPLHAYETISADSSPAAFYENARQLYEAGNYKGALENLQSALLINPNLVDAWSLKGQIHLRLAEYPYAVVAFDRATQLAPENADNWRGKGDAQYAQKQYKNAIGSYEAAIARAPADPAALLGRAHAQLALGLYKYAADSYDDVLQVDRDSLPAWLGQGIALESLGNMEGAARAFDEVIRLDSANSTAWEHKGDVLRESGDMKGALEAYNQVLEIDPKRADILKICGELEASIAQNAPPVQANVTSTQVPDRGQGFQFPSFTFDPVYGVVFLVLGGVVLGILAWRRIAFGKEPEPLTALDTIALRREIDEFKVTLQDTGITVTPPEPAPLEQAGATAHECEFCYRMSDAPVVCEYCRRIFCPDHGSPPAHACSYVRDWERAQNAVSAADPRNGAERPRD
jgi:tetratricopeptide (TPR) repeat protein